MLTEKQRKAVFLLDYFQSRLNAVFWHQQQMGQSLRQMGDYLDVKLWYANHILDTYFWGSFKEFTETIKTIDIEKLEERGDDLTA
jgi:hypothetical protein